MRQARIFLSIPRAISALVLLGFVGCGSSSAPVATGPVPVPPAAAATVFVERNTYTTSTNNPTIYNAAVLKFPASSNGSANPGVDFEQTTSGVEGLALDTSGNLYVGGFIATTDTSMGFVTVYGPSFTATSTPLRTLNLPNNDLPESLFVDAAGLLYVLSSHTGSVYVFGSGASGSDAPLRTITGSNTQIATGQTFSFTVDATGTIFVGNYMPSSILVFAASANGNVSPSRTITVANGNVYGLATDSASNLFVVLDSSTANGDGTINSSASIAKFAAGVSGAASPLSTISGSATTLFYAGALRLDKAGNLWLVSLTQDGAGNYSSHLLEFPNGATGNVAQCVNRRKRESRNSNNVSAADELSVGDMGLRRPGTRGRVILPGIEV